MQTAVTLIGRAESPVRHALVGEVEALLKPTAFDWLAPEIACDLLFDTPPRPEQLKEAEALAAGEAVDLTVVPIAARRKKLLVADMDSTIIQQECIDELAEELGLRDRIAEITERAMRGEIEFEPALRERVALLRGLGEAKLQSVFDARITPTPGGATLTATMRSHGATCALVSGGFTFFTERVAARVGFDVNQANELLMEAGTLSGKVAEPILGRQAKVEALVGLREKLGLAAAETLAVGDGANDLGMIEEAGLGVAFHAKPKVAAEADTAIRFGDLTALLYLQGYRAEEIVVV